MARRPLRNMASGDIPQPLKYAHDARPRPTNRCESAAAHLHRRGIMEVPSSMPVKPERRHAAHEPDDHQLVWWPRAAVSSMAN